MARRIGDVAKAAGVGVETVRFYEREGLIDQPPKPQRGWRDYGDAALGQLEQVRLAQTFGLTLKDMKTLKASARRPQAAFCATVRETAQARLAALDAELAALQAKRAALSAWLGQCKQRDAAAPCPLYDQIRIPVPAKPPRSSR